jgi:hypothetical protein
VDDVELGWIHPAGGAMMPFGHGGSRIIVTVAQHMGDEARYGDDCIGLGKEMPATESRTWAFCQMAGKNKKRSGLDESGCEQGRPVVVAMVGVKNSGADFFEKFGKSQNLQRPKTGQSMKREGMGLRGKRSLFRSGDFDRPSPGGKTVGEGKALGIRAAAPESGVQLENPTGEIRSGH